MTSPPPDLFGDALESAIGYQGKPFPQTHPDRLATLGRLHGLSPAPPGRCRVLELGCGDGSNLLPMAAELAGSEFVGVDLNDERVKAGSAWARELGLGNVRLETRDIATLGTEYGKFDYIIAHGVYCWVPESVRDRALRLCGELLTPQGVSFVSFNTLPGWHFLLYLRDLAQLVRQQSTGLNAQQLLKRVRAVAGLLAMEQPTTAPQPAHLQQLFKRLETTSDYLLAFDYLGEISQPLTLTRFSEHAVTCGLKYICDANYFESSWREVTARTRSAISQLTSDGLVREAFADNFTARLFRRALLCHADAEVRAPQRELIRQLYVLSSPQAEEASEAALFDARSVSFKTLRGAKISVSLPAVKLALAELARYWPAAVSFADLVRNVCALLPAESVESVENTVQGALWEMYSAGAIELRTNPPACVSAAGAHPTASRFARAQLARGDVVTNQHHDFTRLLDEVSRELLPLLDGSRDRKQLASSLSSAIKKGQLAQLPRDIGPQALREEVDQRLNAWAQHALIVS